MSDVAIVLAAGGSRRLGRPKQLVRIDGESLVERAVRVALEAGLIVAVVVGDTIDAGGTGATVLVNDAWEEGMGTSVACGVAWAAGTGARTATILTCDQYMITGEDLRSLRESRESVDAEVAAALYDDVLGVPATFASRCFERLVQLGGDRGARELLRDGSLNAVAVPMPHAARDVDEVADLEEFGA